MSLPLQAIAPDICAAPQLTPEAMAEAAALGFRSVVNNRPDFEHGPDQPTSAAIAAAGQAAGLESQAATSRRKRSRPSPSCWKSCRGRCWCSAAPAPAPRGCSCRRSSSADQCPR